MDCCDVVKEGKPAFKLGGSFVINFSGCSKELAKRDARCYAHNILLEGYRWEGRKTGSDAGALTRGAVSTCSPRFS
jgi:hypothetical protein